LLNSTRDPGTKLNGASSNFRPPKESDTGKHGERPTPEPEQYTPEADVIPPEAEDPILDGLATAQRIEQERNLLLAHKTLGDLLTIHRQHLPSMLAESRDPKAYRKIVETTCALAMTAVQNVHNTRVLDQFSPPVRSHAISHMRMRF
jgi:CBS-domain-containing membrane protein